MPLLAADVAVELSLDKWKIVRCRKTSEKHKKAHAVFALENVVAMPMIKRFQVIDKMLSGA